MQDVVPPAGHHARAARALGRRAGLAAAVGAVAGAARCRSRRPRGSAAPSRPARTRAPGAPTAARATGRPTSAPRTGARSRSRSPPLEQRARDPRLPRGRAAARGRPPAGAPRRAPVRGRTRGRVAARHPRPAQPHPPRLARARRAARAGRRYDVRVRLDAIAHAVPAGHALRLAVSTVYWPWAWPSPEPVTLTLHGGALQLPVRAAARATRSPPSARPSRPTPLAVETIEPGRTNRTQTFDLATGTHEIRFEWDVGGHRRLVEAGTEMEDTNVTIYRITEGDPLSAEVHVRCMTALGRGDWRTRVETDSRMTCTATEFLVTQRLDASEGEERIRSRTWELRVPPRRRLTPTPGTRRSGTPTGAAGGRARTRRRPSRAGRRRRARRPPPRPGRRARGSPRSIPAWRPGRRSSRGSPRCASGATGHIGPIERFGAARHDVDLQRRARRGGTGPIARESGARRRARVDRRSSDADSSS